MTYRATDIATWAARAAEYMETNDHTEGGTPCSREALAEACGFPACQWYKVKQAMIASGYPVGVQPGRGGGFFLGTDGCQATHLVLSEKYIESRLDTTQRQEQALKLTPAWWESAVSYAKRIGHDLGLGAARISTKAQQLALPEPERGEQEAAS